MKFTMYSRLSVQSYLILATLLYSSQTSAQTWINCNPLNETDCPADPALSTQANFSFFESATVDSDLWMVSGGPLSYQKDGAEFTIRGRKESPTLLSKFYMFFGQLSVVMKASHGTGLISSIVLQSDIEDEIDWVVLGGDNTQVETNYFGRDKTVDNDNAISYPVDDPIQDFHNYTTIWTSEKLEWYVDEKLIRTVSYADAQNGDNYPQTPMNVRIGLWVAGDDCCNSDTTIEWAGGLTDYSESPFTMTVQSIYVEDYSEGKEYIYGDDSGSLESIEVISGQSEASKEINSPHGISERWAALPSGGKIGIIAGAGGIVLILLLAILWYFCKQRRRGSREYAKFNEEFAKDVGRS